MTWRLERIGRLGNPVLALIAALAVGCATSSTGRVEARAGNRGNALSTSRRVPSLVGAWRPVEIAVRQPSQPWDVRSAPQGGLFVFSVRHYSYFYLRGEGPRPRFADANRPTEAERAATFDTFIAGAGSYEIEGSTVKLTAAFRKNPNEMTGEIWRWEAEFAGDTVRFVFANPPFLPGRDWRITLVRVE